MQKLFLAALTLAWQHPGQYTPRYEEIGWWSDGVLGHSTVEDSHRVYEPWTAHPQHGQRRPRRIHPGAEEAKVRPLMSVGVAPRSLIILQGPPPARGRIPTPERLFRTGPTPKSGEQFAPLHSNWSMHPDSSVVRVVAGMRRGRPLFSLQHRAGRPP